MRILIILVISIFVSSGLVLSATITSTHPRVWINSTIKARLQADVAANTAEWQALKAYCDDNLASNNSGNYQYSGYHYNNWYNLVMSYGLCFQATGDQTYGNEGVVYLTGLLRDGADSGTIGDGNGGDTGIQKDSGYVSRSAGTGVAIGRDWLDGATNLTQSIIDEAGQRMGTWVTWVKDNAHAIDDPRDNYYYGHFAMIYTSAFSFYGDTNYQSSWLTDAESMWSDEVLPIIENGYYDGGDWAKGWNYAPWANEELLGYLLARDTATDDANPWSVTDYYDDLAKSQLYFLYPNRGQFSDNGMWSADIKGDPRSHLSKFLASMTPLDATRKGVLRWFTDNLTYEPNDPPEWQDFFYKISDVSSVTPTSLNMGGLSYTTDIGHFVSRSDTWSNTDATFVEFFAYIDRQDKTSSTTNGDRNVGDMRIASRGISLIADGDREQYTGHYQNQLYVTGDHTYAPYQEPWLYGKNGDATYPEVSMITADGSGYAYGKILNAQNAYDGTYWTNDPSLSYYTRSQLFIYPDTVIVYDNAIATSSSNEVSIRWWFPRQPTASGQTVTTTDVSADMKMTVLGATGSFATPGTSYDLMAVTGTSTYRDGYYYIDYEPTGTPINNQIITVFDVLDHGATPASVTAISGSGIIGTKVDSTVAIFTSDQSGADISTATYTVDATTHYIADLPVNTNISVTRAGTTIVDAQDSGDVGIIEFTANSGSAEYVVTAGENTMMLPPKQFQLQN